ncbi:MAG: UDP-N-acetylmuramate dehydrogenase [Candidatus Bipolaricaulota bacterium]
MTHLTEAVSHFSPEFPLYREVPLSPYTSWRVGGPADYFFQPENSTQLYQGLQFAIRNSIPWFILGRGSNVLFPEEGYRGLVIQMGSRYSRLALSTTGHNVRVLSGLPVSKLARIESPSGTQPLSFLGGIPGSVGGAIVMNAGAVGKEISDFLVSIRYLDESGHVWEVGPNECGFDYRTSLFQDSTHIIMDAELRLPMTGQGLSLTDLLKERSRKLPLGLPSAGCVFKNPDEYELSAGELIDRAGCKGWRIGDAMVSEKHANFILNLGSARSRDILRLIDSVRERVYKQFGVALNREIQMV